MNRRIAFTLMILTFVLLSACSDSETPMTDTGIVSFEFNSRVGTQNLQLGIGSYQNMLGQDFKVDVLRYYISNIKLKRTDGTFYEDPLSEDGSTGYYLIDDANEASTIVTLNDVPFGAYIGAEFTIGVDASRVAQGAQTGALDPANKLFWTWNAGYIFVQFEGTSPQSTEDNGLILYHTGGYQTDETIPSLANNIKVKSITFGGDEAMVSKTTEPEIHIIVDVIKFFEGSTNVDFSQNAQCHVPSCGIPIANNYENTFVFDHLH